MLSCIFIIHEHHDRSVSSTFTYSEKMKVEIGEGGAENIKIAESPSVGSPVNQCQKKHLYLTRKDQKENKSAFGSCSPTREYHTETQ